jgi:hypothetical protein
MSKRFPTDLTDRGVVKITDKLLIHNIDTGVTEITTVQQLLAALSIYGNVGIGTTAPGGKLDVRGALSLFGGTKGYLYIYDDTLNFGYSTNANHLGYINYNGYANGVAQFRDLAICDGKHTVIVFVDGSTGGVGIGTTTPKSKLDVVGLPNYANNAAALLGGLLAGSFYTLTGSDPRQVCVVY